MNLCRDIEVADGQVDHVGEVLEVAITGRSILDDFDNTVESFADGVGKLSVDEGQDVIEVIAQGCDELGQRREASLEEMEERSIPSARSRTQLLDVPLRA